MQSKYILLIVSIIIIAAMFYFIKTHPDDVATVAVASTGIIATIPLLYLSSRMVTLE